MTAEETVDAVVAGHICIDLIPTIAGRELSFRPGKLVEVGAAAVSTGGPVSNTGIALHLLGARTALIGKTGADALGATLRSILASRSSGLARSMAVVDGEATSYSVILSPPGADRMFLHCPGCNSTFGAADIDYGVVARARLFHFGYPPIMRRMMENGGAELVDVLRRAKLCGATVSLDMCMPDAEGLSGRVDWKSILAAALPYVDVFMPSLEEIVVLLRETGFPAAMDGPDARLPVECRRQLDSLAGSLLALGPAVIGLKLGASGIYLRTTGTGDTTGRGRAFDDRGGEWCSREIWSPCFATSVVGTTGSGDATIAGFLAGLLRGLPPEESLSMACAVGACNVEAADAISGIRGWEDTLRRVADGWPRLAPASAPPGWELHPSGVFLGPDDKCPSGHPPRRDRQSGEV